MAEHNISSSLEPLQTNQQIEDGLDLTNPFPPRSEFSVRPLTRPEAAVRHSFWHARRLKVWQSLLRTHAPASRLDRFQNCGSGLWLRVNPQGTELSLACNACGDRWCSACQVQRAGEIAANLASFMNDETCRFLTLTRRHSNAPLGDQIDSLYACFSNLRRRRWWRDNVTGGAAFLEIKLSPNTGGWHVHLHAVVVGHYLDQRKLSSEWLAVTNDSSIVDVRAIADQPSRARYVTKYVTKPADSSVYNDPSKLDEFVLSIKGRRLCFTFGTWRGKELEETGTDTTKWKALGSVSTVAEQAAYGDPDAVRWWAAALRKWPSLKLFSRPPPPPPEDTF